MSQRPSTPELPALENTLVKLPWDAFRALLPQPKPEPGPAQPPARHALGRGDYRIELAPDHAKVVARYELTVLADEGWLLVPLLRPDEVALSEARLDGEPLTLSPMPNGTLGLCLPASGSPRERAIELSFLAELRGEAPQAQALAFSTPRTPITLLEVRGVRRDVVCAVRPGCGLELSEEEGGVRVARAALPPTPKLELSWRPEAELREERRPSVIGGSVDTRISVGERALELAARVVLSVSGGPAAGVELLLPEGFTLHSAQGDVVRDARPSEGRLRVRFTHDVLGETSFLVRGEVPTDPDQEEVTAPVLALEDSPRARGTVAVDADPRVEVELRGTQGAVRIDPSELEWSPGDSMTTLLALKFVRARPTITLGLRRHKDAPVLVATCDHAHFRALLLDDGKLFVKAHLNVRNNARSFLELRLPEGAELWSAYCGGQPARPSARQGEGGACALIPVPSGDEAAFEVELAYFHQGQPLGEGGQASFPLPALDLPLTYVSLALFLPTRHRHFNFEGGLERVDHFRRAFEPPPPLRGAVTPMSNVMQAFVPTPSGGQGGQGLGGEGQLPIRLPSLERGLEHRFEKTLVVGELRPVEWEHKRRRRAQ